MKIIAVLYVFICLVTSVFGQQFSLTGSVSNDKSEPIEYATIILLGSDSAQVAGAVSDVSGKFLLTAPRGKYTLAIHYLGYESYAQQLDLVTNSQLASILLSASSVAVQDVVVKAQYINREADRFVVNVAASPTSIGKDALEVLKSAPGVWVNQDGIMINGKSGSRVMINERMLNMDADELNTYLKGIKAEDILKIEVIPISGADYDADTRGGVIKITLKRQRNDGLQGSVGISYRFADLYPRASPTFNLNYRQNKLSLYTNLNYAWEKKYAVVNERVDYLTSGDVMMSQGNKYDKEQNYNATLGAIYDISNRQTVGIELGTSGYDCMSNFVGASSFVSAGQIDNTSLYGETRNTKRYNMAVNYILKLDTLGSMFKIIGDINSRKSDIVNDYFNSASIVGSGSAASDTTYRNIGASDYSIYSASADLTLMLSKATKIQTGLKFNYNTMDNGALYESVLDDNWIADNVRSGRDDYSERIAAAYAILSTRVWRLSLSAGLRGEYTNMVPHSDKTTDVGVAKQNYFSLFPNVNISIPLNNTESSSLILAYARTISRPSFWALNPFRTQMSEYSYITGNPWLKPTFDNDFSITTVLSNKYTLALGANMLTNVIRQMVSSDAVDPQVLVYRHDNISREWNYYVSVNAPFSITKWWDMNVNMQGVRQQAWIESGLKTNNAFMANLSTTVTIPKEFFVEMGGYYVSSFMSGNMYIGSMYNFDISVKKRFFKGALTASASVANVLGPVGRSKVRIDELSYRKIANMTELWSMRRFEVALRYNFKSGISFKSKSVESGDNGSRMEGGR